jgi:hypothetical protein
MDRHARVVRQEDRRQRGAPVDTRQPTRVAMGEDVELRADRFLGEACAEDFQAMPPNGLVHRDVLLAN